MRKRWHVTVLLLLLAPVAEASQGPRDRNGYVGTDSLAPGLRLPMTGPVSLTLDASSPTSTGDIASAATLAGALANEDAMYSVNVNAGGTASVFGMNLSGCAASTNGFISCFNGTPSPYFDNRPLPDPRLSSRVIIAPYWDDLTIVPNESSISYEVRNGVSFTVQWNNFSLYSNAAARLTFRATFYLGAPGSNGAVAFHYLSMLGTGADGRSATIGIQSSVNGFGRSNQYAYNKTSAVVVGTATTGLATQAILFDVDGDGDRLTRMLEVTAGSADNDPDSDDGSLDDGAELAAGKDPMQAADDGATTDSDSDGLTDLDEAFYGTNPAAADTDNDGDTTAPVNTDAARTDQDELYGVGGFFTDPRRADTDGDGARDGREIYAGTDPTDRRSFPSVAITPTGSSGYRHVHSALDTNENAHVVTTNNGSLFYAMVSPTGQVLIPATRYKTADDRDIRIAHIGVLDGRAYITYEALTSSGSEVGIVQINPSLAPRDGTAILFRTIFESEVSHRLSGMARHCDAAIGASGIYLACERHPNFDGPDGYPTDRMVEVASFALDGSLRYDVLVGVIPQGPGAGNGDGNAEAWHKVSAPQVVVDGNGVAHVVYMAKARPDDGPNSRSSYYYAQVAAGGAMTGPYYLGPGHAERLAIGMHGSRVMVVDSNGDENAPQGIRVGVFDTAALGLVQRQGDPLGITHAVTMAYPSRTVYADGAAYRGAGISMRSDGQAVITVVGHRDNHKHSACVGAVSATGALQGEMSCDVLDRVGHRQRMLDPLVYADGGVALAFASFPAAHNDCCAGRDQKLVRFAKWDAGALTFTSTTNTAPTFTSTLAASTTRAGQPFSYTATATDTETPTGLAFSLASGPSTASVTAAGALTWTPTAADLGRTDLAIRVCDSGTPPPVMCAVQVISVDVIDALAPMIVSIPATGATIDLPYVYQIVAQDPNDDIASYGLTTGPEGASLSSSGLLTWTPTVDARGIVPIVVTVTDATGLSATQAFNVHVDYGNAAPYEPVGDNGCGCASSSDASASTLGLGLVAGAVVMRRRRRRSQAAS